MLIKINNVFTGERNGEFCVIILSRTQWLKHRDGWCIQCTIAIMSKSLTVLFSALASNWPDFLTFLEPGCNTEGGLFSHIYTKYE